MNARMFLPLLIVVATIPAFAQHSAEWEARTALAKELDIGESAPDWLVDSEAYVFGSNPIDWAALAESKVAFMTHCPVNREFFARCHGLGVRCFPYVTFYQGFANQTYEGLNLKDHPEFIEVDAQGNLTRTGFWESEDAKNMYTTCPNVQGYQDAMVAWIRKVMEVGADGVFVDNLSSRAPCYGPKFGKHEHICEDQNHAFALLLGRVREVIKGYKPDGAVLGNSANPPTLPKEFWKYLDAEMLESYICTWVSKDRWFDWKDHWDKAGKDLQPYVKAGKQIQALSYLGHTPYGVREDAFFCYASARLAGFVWSGGSVSSADTADLFRLRLGKPLTDECEAGGAHYRVFERGLVAVNPDKDKPTLIPVAAPMPSKRFVDLIGGGAAGWKPYDANGFNLDSAVKHGGARSIACVNADGKGSGACQNISLNQSQAASIVVTGWSKAENVSDAMDGNYALYVDITYSDATHLFGQTAPFDVGTHDWQERSLTIHPDRPVQTLTLYALLRYKTGEAWFDDITLSEEGKGDCVRNGGFEELDREGKLVDTEKTGVLEIPAYSGRVFLFASDTKDELAVTGPRLTIKTSPPLGEVRFRVDGFDYWTHSGRWTTEYVMEANFGTFDIVFDKSGKHTVEIVDITPADMKTAAGYGNGSRLGQFMDPSNPTKPSQGKKFKFREWTDRGTAPQIELDVNADTIVNASFDIETPNPADR